MSRERIIGVKISEADYKAMRSLIDQVWPAWMNAHGAQSAIASYALKIGLAMLMQDPAGIMKPKAKAKP